MESFKKVSYADLTSVQKESYAFCKIQSVMTEFGWLEYHRLNDDHNGADFVAFHVGGKSERFQQKARFTLNPKYYGIGLKVVVYDEPSGSVYIYDHDDNFDAWEEKRMKAAAKLHKSLSLRSKTLPKFSKVTYLKL